ncbi:uncharacterized protein ColSpa_12827 [Colletotrichum spaethianum]|uniref:Uncharacterized protein n=1 Tax=Colletotrichum spaethianum TaxID=700344 RepID=A0AA37PHY7_9PEZI|nr:uncharacterized protein ColSpa_05330 [Colletotrichum spaethianum]XP_049134996.1 uncharacterized protein ColSpa_12827 [Colletotrichum spaethianum]GKT45149.1 hypothetical protein ColSpa_05330 [Colletotrichum spaethianum]GKT52646.1 hypothetical protein ColSpa_12827 [Colletotrichum spaethianum]
MVNVSMTKDQGSVKPDQGGTDNLRRLTIKMLPLDTKGAPTFDGCNITDFLDKYEALTGLAGYSDKEKTKALLWYLPDEHRATVKIKAEKETW